jgi:hypothetical protein
VLFLPGRLLLGFIALATLALPFVRLSRLPIRRLVRSGRRFLRLCCWLEKSVVPFILAEVLRQFGVFAEGPCGSHGTLEDHAMVAAMTSGSWLVARGVKKDPAAPRRDNRG